MTTIKTSNISKIPAKIERLTFFAKYWKGKCIDCYQPKYEVNFNKCKKIFVSIGYSECQFLKAIKKTNIDDVMSAVAFNFGLAVDDLKIKTRKREIVEPRQISMYFMRKLNLGSFDLIAKSHGDFDHSTAIHCYNTVTNLISVSKDFAKKIDKIENLI